MQNLDSNQFILDANAFYAGMPFLSSSASYTTNSVFDEVKHIKKSYYGLQALIDAGNLKVLEPEESFLRQIKAVAKKTGDISTLSVADLSILALALQLKKTIISDDYAVANIASQLNIPIKNLSAKGIRTIRKWIAFCIGCDKSYDSNITECQLCGNKLRRRYRRASRH